MGAATSATPQARRGRPGRQAAILAAMVAVCPPIGLGAQTPGPPPGTAISDGERIPVGEVGRHCVALPGSGERAAPAGAHPGAATCRVVETGSLLASDSVTWRWALYRRVSVRGAAIRAGQPARSVQPDTLREEELVLFVRRSEDSTVRPVWFDRTDVRFELLRPPRAAPLPGSAPGALLAHRRCLNGTGGCRDHPYVVRPDGSVEPLRPVYIRQLHARLPADWGTWKGVWLDPVGPAVEAPVYVPADANCCPSFRAVGSLVLDGDSLFVDSVELAPAAESFAWEVVPGRSFGHVTAETSEAELVRSYGEKVVEPSELYLAEGFCTPGTRVFSNPRWRIEVAWADSARSRPAFARATGSEGPWHTRRGVRLGTTLAELEALRGEPVVFSGLGWDYGGGVWWAEGEGGLRLLIGPDSASNRLLGEELRKDPRADELFGETSVSSDHPIVRRLRMPVERMTLDWANPAISRECEGS